MTKPFTKFVPPPRGLNFLSYMVPGVPEYAVCMNNLRPATDGLQTVPRVNTSVTLSGMRSIFAHAGTTFFTTNDAMIAAGLGTSAVSLYTLSGVDTPGVGWATNFTTAARAYTLFFNGYNTPGIYDGTSWSAAAWTGTTLSNLFQGVPYRGRLYFADKTGSQFWYLPSGAITGALTQYNCGSLLKKGGNIVAMSVVTKDGGLGPDDWLAVYFSNGELILFGGNDPASSDWAVVGVYDVGMPAINKSNARPFEPRLLEKLGGDLLLLNTTGLYSLNAIIAQKGDIALATPISASLGDQLRQYLYGETGWITVAHNQKLLVLGNRISSTFPGLSAATVFMLDLETGGWFCGKSTYATSYVCEGVTSSGPLLYGVVSGNNTLSTLFAPESLYVINDSRTMYETWALVTQYGRYGQLDDLKGQTLRTHIHASRSAASINPIVNSANISVGVSYDGDLMFNDGRIGGGTNFGFAAPFSWVTSGPMNLSPMTSTGSEPVITQSNRSQARMRTAKMLPATPGVSVALGMSGTGGALSADGLTGSGIYRLTFLGWDFTLEQVAPLGT